ncbi:hypothetical protein PPTG_24875 [Phytophthora nicotianae INRA-310]|uniref:Uncharacterized protein n=1 Tax=Phytophthora nicotianae (strain INRA-310) TaxID=761204 RepID=W2P9D8_PHYN3|nr:hypothetical protein PPTG_24875 [Phytophthora nicotianae INRA-310]ETM97657.1 hypothetical protein PPTG_24875 [Phytophthora nicotianae INRA-310]
MTEIATVQRSHSRDKPKDGTEDSSGHQENLYVQGHGA